MSDSVIGKRVLVDIAEYDRDLRVRLRADYAGIVVAVTATTVHIKPDGMDEVAELKATPDSLQTATPGPYQLQSGEPVAPPDLLARWSHYDRLPGYARVVIEYPTAPDNESSPPAA